MGDRGPRPLPSNVRRLNGETRPSRLNPNEVMPRQATPEPPAWLGDRATEVWNRTVVELAAMKVLAASDVDSLVIYCQAVAHYEEAVRLVNASGMLIRGRLGEVVKNPAMQFVRDQATLVQRMAREFGLTPSARVGLTGETVESSDAERLLG